jgi:hypothetical protein
MAEKRGEVPDAFTHPELGPIAFVYGDEKMGLRHIEAKRGIQWVNRIPEILRSGKIDRDPTLPRVFVVQDSDPANVAVIRLDWDGQQKTWLVTAHQDDKGRWGEQGKTSRTTLTGGQVQGNPSLSDSPAGSVAQDLLGDKPNTSQQQAADERARRAGQDQQRRNAAPAPEEFALGMEDARTGREVDPRQQDMELLRQVDEAVQDADADTLPGFSRSASTKAAYEARIDALFAGGKPTLDGVRVLDRSDMLALLGMGDGPVNLAEGKVTAGQDNHPHMTAAMWKKIPQWLDNPALVFDSDTTPGRLVFIAPELVNGAHGAFGLQELVQKFFGGECHDDAPMVVVVKKGGGADCPATAHGRRRLRGRRCCGSSTAACPAAMTGW